MSSLWQIPKKPGSNSYSPPAQKAATWQRPFSDPIYDAVSPKQEETITPRAGFNLMQMRIFPDSPAPVQAKLTVGAPGDKYEPVADIMASQVMKMSAPENEEPVEGEQKEVQRKPLAEGISPIAQREIAPEESPLQNKTIQRDELTENKPEEEDLVAQKSPAPESIQRDEATAEEKPQEDLLAQKSPAPESIQRDEAIEDKPKEEDLTVQQKAAPEGKSSDSGNLESQLNGSKGGGSPLADEVRAFMEPRFGADFSGVRVHTDSNAVQMNKDLGAQAFAHGSDIYYGAGKSPGKDELTAHELTHTVQQMGIADKSSEPKALPAINMVSRQVKETGKVAAQASRAGAMLGQAASWSREQLIAIQTELKRLGLYQSSIDGKFGPGTESGLVEAFGGDGWRGGTSDIIINFLKRAQAHRGKSGQHNLRYGEMFKDSVLDMTLGVGFDEGGNNKNALESFKQILAQHGFKEDRATAEQIYKQAGRSLGSSAFGMFFVRKNALIYKPPAALARKIDAVVRLVVSPNGSQGAKAADAFREGMAQSDIAYYSGHGRYGSGPDFDRNMSFELFDDKGQVTQQINDYDKLEQHLTQEGAKSGRTAWRQFLWRVDQHRINVIGANQGNVYINPTNLHGNEFGAKLMYWNLNRKDRQGVASVTGEKNYLAQVAAANPERKYRLWVFDGCRTQDYVQSIRSTPGYDTRSTDMLVTKRTINWGDEGKTLAVFLDSVLQQQSAEEIVRGMDAQQSSETPNGQKGGAYSGDGLQDNPLIR